MSKNISEIPYTELFERISALARTAENSREKTRGIIQDVYAREIGMKFDWDFLISSSSITTTPQQNTGTVSINTGDTSAVFSSLTLDATFTGRKIKFSSADAVYTLTYVDATGGTVSPAFQANTNISNGGYVIYKENYALAGDFDRFPTDGGPYLWEGGKPKILLKEDYLDALSNYSATPSTPEKHRLSGADTAGRTLMELLPAPAKTIIVGYDYLRALKPLKESSAGTVTVSAGGTSVIGDTNTYFTEMTTGDWFRVSQFGQGQDSSWYRILAIQDNSSLTLQTVFGNSGATTAPYALASAPQMPANIQASVLYGSLRALEMDQNDENFQFYHVKFAEVLTDGKRLYVTRRYSQEFKTVGEEFLYRR